MSKDQGELKWDKARSQMMINFPFYAYVMSNLQWKKSGEKGALQVPTAATDGSMVVYNPEFTSKLKTSQVMTVIAHEVMHVMLMHPLRRGNRNPFVSNIAMDICINYILKKDGFEAIEGWAYDEKLYEQGKGIWENVYELLMEDIKKQLKRKGKSSGQNGGDDQDKKDALGGRFKEFDKIIDGPKDPAKRDQLEQEINDMIGSAVAVAKQAGKGSMAADILAGQIGKPKVDYRQVLRRFFTSPAKIDYSYQRPSRRSVARDAGYYLPSLTGERLGEVALLVDCSGSMCSQEILNRMAGHMNAICEDTRPTRVHVVYFDSDVCHVDVFEEGDPIKIAMRGGGGTDFAPPFKYAMENIQDCEVCVMLTDNQCYSYGPCPPFPVLFVIYPGNPTKVPFGDSVEMVE